MKWTTKVSNFYLHLKSFFCGQPWFTFHSFFCLFCETAFLSERRGTLLAVSAAYKYSYLFRIVCNNAMLRDEGIDCIPLFIFSFSFKTLKLATLQHSHISYGFHTMWFQWQQKLLCQRTAFPHRKKVHNCSGLRVLCFGSSSQLFSPER